ncbi:MAG TPA: glycerophosphodiester phosphodiesterase family protein [Gemmatimonadaceae bacterium]|nr:glycerophosphodiester phosphodiesterase family protein [Gemmatimonadaceae bacterium]
MILLDPTAHPIIGHRGASAEAPENTLPAFLRAIEQGVDAIELDVHVTADDIPVVMHDPTVMRTTSGEGAIATMSLRRLQELDAGARFSPDGGATHPYREKGVRVPTVEEVLASIPPDMPMLIEVKAIHAQWALRRVLERFKAAPRCVVAAFEAGSLNAFLEPPFACGASRRDVLQLMARTAAGLGPGRVPYRAICPPNEYYGVPVPVGLIVRGARQLKIPVHVWTVDEPREARRLWGHGVNGIISNAPRRILEERKSKM